MTPRVISPNPRESGGAETYLYPEMWESIQIKGETINGGTILERTLNTYTQRCNLKTKTRKSNFSQDFIQEEGRKKKKTRI